MKKSMVITALLLSLPLATSWVRAEPDTHQSDRAAAAPLSTNPALMMPGVSPLPQTPLSAPSAASALPGAILMDLTNAPNPFDSRKAGLEGQTEISYTLV